LTKCSFSHTSHCVRPRCLPSLGTHPFVRLALSVHLILASARIWPLPIPSICSQAPGVCSFPAFASFGAHLFAVFAPSSRSLSFTVRSSQRSPIPAIRPISALARPAYPTPDSDLLPFLAFGRPVRTSAGIWLNVHEYLGRCLSSPTVIIRM
jgi:hypothetical protein